MTEEIYNVNSYNQSGGVTAHTVNVNLERHLNDQSIENLTQKLESHKGKNIRLTSIMGDSEAFQFASEIKDYLESSGWDVKGVNQAVYSNPIKGQIINEKEDGIVDIIIGSK